MKKMTNIGMRIIALMLIIVVSVFSGRTVYAEDDVCSVVFEQPDPTKFKVAEGESVAVDLYKIATFEPNGTKYTYYPDSDFKSLFENSDIKIDFTEGTGSMTSEQKDAFADECAKIVFAENSSLSTVENTNIQTMYLAIPRSNKVQSSEKAKYSDVIDGKRVSFINGIYDKYIFKPFFIFTSVHQLDENKKLNVSINKYISTPLLGEVYIEKKLNSNGSSNNKPVTFVFKVQIEVEVDGTKKWKDFDVQSITFTNNVKDVAIVKNIPLGTKVRVNEVYSGASYDVEVPDTSEKTVAISVEKKNETSFNYEDNVTRFVFENGFREFTKHGYGIQNTFVYDKAQWDKKQEVQTNE